MILITSAVDTYPKKITQFIRDHTKHRTLIANLYRDAGLLSSLNPRKVLIHFRGTGYSALLKDGRFNVVNDLESIANTTKKHYGQMKALSLGIKSPDTFSQAIPGGNIGLIEQIVDIAFEEKGWKTCVIKPTTSKGQGAFVLKLERDSFKETLKSIEPSVPKWFLQETISFKRLVRVMTIGGRIIEQAVTYDYPREGEWKCSVCMNPRAMHDPDPDPLLLDFINQITERLTLTCNRGISYIDVFDTDQGYVYNETNTSCNLIHQERITGVPLAALTANYLIKEYEKHIS